MLLEKLQSKLTEFVEKISSPDNKLIDTKEAREIDEKYAAQRHSLLWEVTESAVARWLPTWWKVADLFTSLGIKNWDPEAVIRQKEFESLTAWTMFVPDFLLKTVTKPISKIPWFEILLKNYPIWAKTKRKLLDKSWNLIENPNPDDVINFLRLVNQDIITWNVAIKKAI